MVADIKKIKSERMVFSIYVSIKTIKWDSVLTESHLFIKVLFINRILFHKYKLAGLADTVRCHTVKVYTTRQF